MVTPPSEFSRLGLFGEWIKASSNEWHGPCPKCGGNDRFVIFTDRPFPSWNFFCRQCHPETGWINQWWPDLKEMKPVDYQKIKIEQAEHELRDAKARVERIEVILSEIKQTQIWMTYHQQMTDEAAKMWEKCGIPGLFQEYWKLGYDPSHTVYTGSERWITPTLTIPIFEAETWNVLNIKHRLLNPPRPGDKYRPERAGLPQSMFVAEPDNPIAGTTILVEGEKKAMVTFITADNPSLQVVGLPGKNPSKEILAKFDKCDPLYICLDPDARKESYELSNNLWQERCRIIELPDKIDDLIIKHSLGKYWFREVLRQAVKP